MCAVTSEFGAVWSADTTPYCTVAWPCPSVPEVGFTSSPRLPCSESRPWAPGTALRWPPN